MVLFDRTPIADIRRSGSNTPAINTLPVELLCSIFRFAIAKPYPHLGTIDIHRQNLSTARLTRVCQLWRNVAIQDSVLWCNIAFSTSRLSSVRCAAVFLRRSRGAALKIQIMDVQDYGTIAHFALVANLLDDIAEQSCRIVEFEAVGLSELVSEALVHRANNLHRLIITCQPSEKVPVIFGGQIPRLKRLTLSNPTGWKLDAFQGVTKVALFCEGSDFRLISLIDFLDGARNLQVLSLSRYRDDYDRDRRTVRQSVTLPSLRELNLSFCGIPRLLGHLDLPDSVRISILVGPEFKSQDIFQCLPSSPRFRRFLADTKSISLVMNAADNEFYLSMYHRDKASCFLRVYDDRNIPDEGWILRSIDGVGHFEPFRNIESLTVSAGDYQVQWGMWLPRLNGLVTLETRTVDLEGLVRALRPNTASHKPIPCPSLRHLSVGRTAAGTIFDFSILRSCLLARARTGYPVFRLRFRSEHYEGVTEADPCWQELVLSEGEVPGTLDFPCRSSDISESSKGSTTILLSDFSENRSCSSLLPSSIIG